MTTKEFAIEFATKLISDYPQALTVEDLMDVAIKDGRFEDNHEMLAVWGRVLRILPSRGKVSA